MAYKAKRTNVKKVLATIAVTLAFLLCAGAITALFVKLDRQTTTTTIGNEVYAVGAIDDEGKVVESTQAIYTRSDISIDGLKIDMSEDSNVKYQVFFYDKEGKLLGTTTEMTESIEAEQIAPDETETVKIMVVPMEDSDGKITFAEIFGYAKQLTITVNR